MKIHVSIPGNNHIPGTPEWSWRLTPAEFRQITAAVDQLDFDALSTSEHFAMPYFEVPRLGPFWLHALSVMAFIAGGTENIRIDTHVLVLPYHQPLALAKALASIDHLSGGRLNVAVGVGHAEAEFASLGVPFEERGARSDEILAAMEELWRADEPVFHGHFYDIEGLAFEPKPVQRPRPPITIGGNSKPALRRAARYDGWQPNPSHITFEEIGPLWDYLRAQPDFVGKEGHFELDWLPSPQMWEGASFGVAGEAARRAYAERLLEWFAHLASHDVTRNALPLPPTESLDEFVDYLRWFDTEVTPRLAK
jgi:probable F420-dependent oxidoreductase